MLVLMPSNDEAVHFVVNSKNVNQGESMKKVLVIGGAGYCGSVLVPQLLEEGWAVTILDILVWYGSNHLPKGNPQLRVIQGDIRDTAKVAEACVGQDAVLHLACISNDASFELDERLSTSVNLESFEPLVIAAKKAGWLDYTLWGREHSGITSQA